VLDPDADHNADELEKLGQDAVRISTRAEFVVAQWLRIVAF
jgi:hypothetical protein